MVTESTSGRPRPAADTFTAQKFAALDRALSDWRVSHLDYRVLCYLASATDRQTRIESASYGTHSMRRTKAAQIYRKTGNLRAVQLLLGHTKLESTVRYLGIEVDDALNIAKQIEL
jgi:integrase